MRGVPLKPLVCLMLWIATLTGAAQDLPPGPTPPKVKGRKSAPPVKEEADEKAQAQAYLDELIKLYEAPMKSGLNSLGATLTLRQSKDPGIQRFLAVIVVDYSWDIEEKERIQVKGVSSGVIQKSLKEPLQGIWRDLVGAGFFPFLEDHDLALVSGEMETSLLLSKEDKQVGRVVFDSNAKIALRCETPKGARGLIIEPSYQVANKRLRLESRSYGAKGGRGQSRASYHYSSFRKVSGFDLPTKLIIELKKDLLEFKVEYATINDSPAVLEAMDIKVVKQMISDFNKKYPKWTTPEKIKGLRKLEETGHNLAAEAVLKKGLKDKDLTARLTAVEILGAMEYRKGVSHLGKALRSNEDNNEVYLALLKCLGVIGDKKGVPYLEKDNWDPKGAGRNDEGRKRAMAKIEALGMIRSKDSVEALINRMYMVKRGKLGGLARSLNTALKKLTNQDFGHNRDLWKGWWSKNKSKFKLEED